jgi:hypothetical protein
VTHLIDYSTLCEQAGERLIAYSIIGTDSFGYAILPKQSSAYVPITPSEAVSWFMPAQSASLQEQRVVHDMIIAAAETLALDPEEEGEGKESSVSE